MNTQNPTNAVKQGVQNLGRKTSNFAKEGIQKYQNSSSMGKVIFIIILVLFIAFIIYVIYIAVTASKQAAANSPVVVNDVIDAYIARPAFS